MALKQLVTVKYNTFNLEVPCTKQTVKFRQFNVQEYKLFLQAKSINNTDSLISTLNDIIEACSFGVLDADTLEPSSIEYLFLMLRAKSYTDLIPITYICNKLVSKSKDADTLERCGTRIHSGVNLNNIVVIKSDTFDEYKTVFLDEETQGIKLKEPSAIIKKFITDEKSEDDLFGIPTDYLFDCIEFIFDEDRLIYPNSEKLSTDEDNTTEFNREELDSWIDTIPKDTLPQFHKFFDNLPKLGLNKPIVLNCPSCGTIEEKYIEDFESFLD